MPMRLKPSYSRQLLGLVVGYIVGDLLVSYVGLQRGIQISLEITSGFTIALVIITGVVVAKFPRGSYGRKLYRYWIGQLGAWLASLLIGGFLPLLKSYIYSEDILTYIFLVPPLVIGL